MKASTVILIASIIFGIGGWMVTLEKWIDASTPTAMGGLLMVVGSVIAAWLGKSPLKGQQ